MSTEAEFTAVVEPMRRALRLHCYRMLGSSHDSDDLVQETMLRAWRARDTLADPARVKPWLYRIATNACLDELTRRPARALASDSHAPSAGDRPPAPPIEDAAWLEPMPDTWLAGVAQDPEARYLVRESVALAFVAALQVLTPAQRAAFLLRDIVGLSAEEAAAALEQSVDATHSVLHRARATIEDKVGHRDPASFGPVAREDAVLARYMRAISECDVDAMLALVHDEMETTMPPSPTWIRGRDESLPFYRRMVSSWRPGDVRIVPVGVNGGAGFEFYRGGVLRAIEAVEVRDDTIYRMHHFMQPAIVALFGALRP